MNELTLQDIFCFVCGSIIVYRCGEHVEMMRWHSNHLIRLAYWSLSVGGAALVFSAVSADTWLRPLGWICVVAGVTVLCLFDRRAALDHEREQRREPSAG